MFWLILFLVFAILIIFILIVKIIIYKQNLKEVKLSYMEAIKTDTNSKITISTRSKEFKNLVLELNNSLNELKILRMEYNNGNKELRKIIINLSHDLRTPITAIIGYLNLLEEKNIKLKELDIIQKRVYELKDLTEDLFRYVLLTEVHQEMTKINVIKILEDTLLSFYESLKQANLEVNISFTNKEIFVNSNTETIQRIFGNIFSNIIKYAEQKLDIKVEERKIYFSNPTSKFDNIQVGKIFDRYFTVSYKEHGTGLGLDIARSLIEEIGGNIKASLQDNIFTLIVEF